MSWVLKKVLPINQFQSYAVNGTDLYVANEDNQIRIWNLKTDRVTTVLSGHNGKITSMFFNSQWKILFSTSIDGMFCIWSGGKLIGHYINKQLRTDPFGKPLYSCCFYSKKDQVFVGGSGEILVFQLNWEFLQKLHDKEEPQIIKPMQRIKLHFGSIHKLIVAQDKLISASHERTLGFTNLDALNVSKVVTVGQGRAISTIIFDSPSQIIYVGTLDGHVHSFTRDGMSLQCDSVGSDDPIIDMAIDPVIGLLWVVLETGELRLLDFRNLSINLTQYFETLREKPIIGLSTVKFYRINYDPASKIITALVNDHYVLQYGYDEAAAAITIQTPKPMHALKMMTYKPTKSGQISFDSPLAALKDGVFVIGGEKTLTTFYRQSKFSFSEVFSVPINRILTTSDFVGNLIAVGDNKGYSWTVNTLNMKLMSTSTPALGPVSSIHINNKHLIVTSLAGSWHVYSMETAPEPYEEVVGRELAHNGAINGSAFANDLLVTAGSDGMVKGWSIGTGAKQMKKANVFLTASTVQETNVVDMRKYGEVLAVEWAVKGKVWITSHSDRQIRIWNASFDDCQLKVTIPCGGCNIVRLAVEDPRLVLAALDDNTIRAFNLKNGELMTSFIGHTNTICGLSADPNANFYVSSSWDGVMKLWNRVSRPSLPPIHRPTTSMVSSRKISQIIRTPSSPKETYSYNYYPVITNYDRKKQEIERKERRERAQFEAKMRSPLARELREMSKMIYDMI